jgi:hypothetical protein
MKDIMDTPYECNFANVFDKDTSAEFKCNIIANKACVDQQDFLNFFQIFLCGFNGSLIAMIPFVLISLFLIFKFICALVD